MIMRADGTARRQFCDGERYVVAIDKSGDACANRLIPNVAFQSVEYNKICSYRLMIERIAQEKRSYRREVKKLT